MNQKNRKIMAIVFVCIIFCLPAIFANRENDKVSVTENRGLARFPVLEDAGGFNKEYMDKLETYIDDNIGFKQNAVILKIGLLYACFQKLDVPNYYIGKEQNLFYSDGMNQIHNYQGKNLFSEEEASLLAEKLDGWNQLVREQNGLFLFMPVPDKEGVYSEFYPDEVLRNNEKFRIDCLAEEMSEKEWYIDIKQALIANKGSKMLYYRNYDPTHWNMNGAWIGYQELMKKIVSVYGDIEVLTEEKVSFAYEKSPGNLQHLSGIRVLNNIMHFDDEIVSCVPKGGYRAELVNDAPEPLVDNQIFFHYLNRHVENGKTLLIIGDSYMYGYILPLLAESFSNVYFTNFVSGEAVNKLQEMTQPDIVLYELVDRVFYYWPLMEGLDQIVK